MRWSVRIGTALAILSLATTAIAGSAVAQQAALDRFESDNPQARLYYADGDWLTRVYGTAFGFGASPEDTAATFVQSYAGMLGVNSDNLLPGNQFDTNLTLPVGYDPDTGTYKCTLVYYAQYENGIPVFEADLRALVRNEDGFPLVWVGNALRDLGDFTVPNAATLAAPGDLGHSAALAAVPDLVNFTPAEYVIWAGADHPILAPRLAVKFIADNGRAATSDYAKWLFLADAQTGQILHSENLIVAAAINGNVSGMATTGWAAEVCGPEASTPFKYARVTRGSVIAYADGNGNFTIDDGGSSPVTLTSYVRGRYFVVLNAAGAEDFINLSVSAPGPANFLHNSANTVETYKAEVNAYVQANIVRDYLLSYIPNFPTISTQTEFPANVMVSGTCNAFYDGSSINFYPAGGGCNNTAFGTVIHHEYGHHIVQMAGSGQDEYGEGFGDCMGVLITDQSLLAIGFQNCATGLRDANNTCQYSASNCSSCGSEIHDCGMLLSGCVWSIRTNLRNTNPATYRDIISNIVLNSVLMHSGGGINNQLPIDFLTVDDNIYGDGDIQNGTPHRTEICDGFSAHGLTCPVLPALAFNFPNGRPAFVNPNGGNTVRVVVTGVSEQPQPDTGTFYYKIGAGSWTNTPMQVVSPNLYDAVVPASTCGSTISYYFSARSTLGTLVLNPLDAPTNVYSTLSGYGLITVFTDDFNTNQGWTVQNGSGLTSGTWQRGIPVNCSRGDPPSDYDGSGYCYVTDNNPSNCDSDVDGGITWLISPTLDLSLGDAKVTYALWYTNNFGADPNNDLFNTYVSNNNGSTWVVAETIGPVTADGWNIHTFKVGDFVTPTATVKVRFEASDLHSGSVVEAGIDAFRVERVDCNPPFQPGDLNCDGRVDNFDITPFVLALTATPPDYPEYYAQYPSCQRMNGDINGDGLVDNFDITPFVALLTGQ